MEHFRSDGMLTGAERRRVACAERDRPLRRPPPEQSVNDYVNGIA
jgi:hypothetical protein